MLNINKYMGSGKFYILLDDSTEFQNPLKASICIEKKILVSSGLFRKLPGQCIFYFLMISHPSGNSYNQINTLFTTTYLPSISPKSGSAETK